MKIDTFNWHTFNLVDLFDIIPGIYHAKSEYSSGTTPYISASNTHNAISEYIDIEPEFKGNCIITGKVGCTAFYQKYDFCATSDVNIFIPKFEITENIGLFIVTIINFEENYRWGYGRQCRIRNSKKISIKLPAKKGQLDNIIIEDGFIPDFLYMENYMNSLHNKRLNTKLSKPDTSLKTREWKAFKISYLFNNNIYKAVPHHEINLNICSKDDPNAIPYITRTEENNACKGYVINEGFKDIESGNAITIGDTTSTIFYQKDKFITGDHIVVLRAEWLNLHRGLFIVTLLQKEKFRYSYGRAFKKDIILDTSILLPVNKENKPDWNYIDKYMNSLPYSDKLI